MRNTRRGTQLPYLFLKTYFALRILNKRKMSDAGKSSATNEIIGWHSLQTISIVFIYIVTFVCRTTLKITSAEKKQCCGLILTWFYIIIFSKYYVILQTLLFWSTLEIKSKETIEIYGCIYVCSCVGTSHLDKTNLFSWALIS